MTAAAVLLLLLPARCLESSCQPSELPDPAEPVRCDFDNLLECCLNKEVLAGP